MVFGVRYLVGTHGTGLSGRTACRDPELRNRAAGCPRVSGECLATVWYDEVEKSDTILVTYTIVWRILRIENSLTIREG